MKDGRFQAKDIDDRFFLACVDYLSMQQRYPWSRDIKAVLGFDLGLWRLPRWVNRGDLDYVMPPFPHQVILAKARALMRRKLLGGCGCGCRGDFELTQKGREFLAEQPPPPCPNPRAARLERRRMRRTLKSVASVIRQPLPEWPDLVLYKGVVVRPEDLTREDWSSASSGRLDDIARAIAQTTKRWGEPKSPVPYGMMLLGGELVVLRGKAGVPPDDTIDPTPFPVRFREPAASVGLGHKPGPPTVAEILETVKTLQNGIFDPLPESLTLIVMPDRERVREAVAEMLGAPPEQTAVKTSLSEDRKTMHVDATVVAPSPELAERLLAMGGRWGEPVETKYVGLTFGFYFGAKEPE